jgi:hypothetical protein
MEELHCVGPEAPSKSFFPIANGSTLATEIGLACAIVTRRAAFERARQTESDIIPLPEFRLSGRDGNDVGFYRP